jgi:hypothetical protein
MTESDSELERSTRVLAGGVCLILAAVALPIGLFAQIGNGFIYDSKMNVIGVTMTNELGAQLSTVLTALAGYLLLGATIGLSGAVRGRGARVSQAGVVLLGLASMLVAMVFTTTGPLQLLEAASPPAGVSANTVWTVARHAPDAWSFIAVGAVLPCFLLAPFVLGSGLFRARLIPIWPVLLWFFAIAGILLPPSVPNHNMLSAGIFALGILGSLGWMGLAVSRRTRGAQSMAVGREAVRATLG